MGSPLKPLASLHNNHADNDSLVTPLPSSSLSLCSCLTNHLFIATPIYEIYGRPLNLTSSSYVINE